MKQPSENTNPTRRDWEEACREIKKLVPQHYETLISIRPYMPEPGKTADTSPVYFSIEDKNILNSIINKLSRETAKYCSIFMRLYAKACYIPAPELILTIENQQLKLPAEIMEKHAAPHLDRPSLSALMSTCRFFYTGKSLRNQKAAMPRYRICAGQNHTLVFTHNKLLVCGSNFFGQLGLGLEYREKHCFVDAMTGILATGETVLQVTAGGSHTLILTSQQRLLVCGDNSYGQLGQNNTYREFNFSDALAGVLAAGEVVLQVAAGNDHTLVMTSQQRLLVCGRNNYGQLGLGHTNDQSTLIDALAGILAAGEIVLQVATGGNHTLVLTSQQRLLVCGDNYFSQLGLGNTNKQPGFIDALAGVLSTDETVLQVTAGAYHTLVLTSQQRLLVCGDNNYGQLGPGCAAFHQPSFINAPTGALSAGETILQVAAGGNHTLILTSQQRLLVCGGNRHGQLGLGHRKEQHRYIDALAGILAAGETVLQVAAGVSHSLVLTSHRLLVCGDNSAGQLGLEQTDFADAFVSHPLFDISALCTESLFVPSPMEEQAEESNNCCIQ